MKTTRTNCFETNSSSTHSLTIVSKSTLKDKTYSDLIVDGVLYPAALRDTSAYRSVEYGDGGYSLHANTFAEKAALTIMHLISSLEYKKEIKKEILEYASELIVNTQKGIDRVQWSDITHSGFYGYNEDGELSMASKIEEAESDVAEIKEIVLEYFETVVLDDDKTVIEEDTPY